MLQSETEARENVVRSATPIERIESPRPCVARASEASAAATTAIVAATRVKTSLLWLLDPDSRVHDTPGLYAFGGAVFTTCPGVNPTLTIWAPCYRAAEQLVERQRRRAG